MCMAACHWQAQSSNVQENSSSIACEVVGGTLSLQQILHDPPEMSTEMPT